jgi:hypothetical protein
MEVADSTVYQQTLASTSASATARFGGKPTTDVGTLTLTTRPAMISNLYNRNHQDFDPSLSDESLSSSHIQTPIITCR